MRLFQLILVFLALTGFVYSQETIISGIIKDQQNVPLPGVSILIKSTNKGASTNGNGYFIIEGVSSEKHILVISCIGYTTIEKEIDANSAQNTNLLIELVESVSSLNEVVVMSGGNSGMKNIPGSVQYISPKDLDKFSYTDINRALRTVPGINMQEEDGFGLRPNIGLRATGVERSSKITLMEDGILMAPAPYVAPAAYYFPTMGRMQGIEVMKGSSQIKYGPYTTGGALNLISTQIPDQLAGKINLMFGSYGSNNLHATVGNSSKRVGFLVETFQYGSDGFKELDGGGNTGFTKSDYIGKIRVNTSENAKIYQSLTLKIGKATESSNETYLGLTDDDFALNPVRRYTSSQKDVMNTDQNQISVTHEVRFNSSTKLITTIYRNEFERNWYKLDKVQDTSGKPISISTILQDPTTYERAFDIIKGSSTNQDEGLFVKANNRSYYSQGIQTVLANSFQTGEVGHDINFGIRLHEDQVDRFQWVDEYSMAGGIMKLNTAGEPGTESNKVETGRAMATYIQYHIKFDRVTISPGLRYENMTLTKLDYGTNDVDRTESDLKTNENKVDVFLPGIGVDYKMSPFFNTFIGYHKGFAPPGTKEGTLPEECNNFELGSRYRKNAFSFQAVFFYNDYKNLLGADLNASGGTGSNDLFNGGKAESMGIEFQIGHDLLSGNRKTHFSVPVQLSYTFTDAHFLSSFESEFEGWGNVEKGDQLPYLANHQLSFLIGVLYKRISFNVSIRYMDEMRTEPGQGPIPDNQKTDEYLVTDLSLSLVLQKQLSLFANATNISDEAYIVSRRPAGVRPGMPRAFNMGIKASF